MFPYVGDQRQAGKRSRRRLLLSDLNLSFRKMDAAIVDFYEFLHLK